MSKPAAPDDLVNGKLIAKRLGVAYTTLLSWIAAGVDIPYYRLDSPQLSCGNLKTRKDGSRRRRRRVIRFSQSEIGAWLERRHVAGQ